MRRITRRRFEQSRADAAHRVHGAFERLQGPARADAGDHVIEARVRSHLGHVVGHSAALEVLVTGGRVRLRGPILEAEADEAIRCARAVPGVHEVVDELDRHAGADIPSLQGEPTRPRTDLWPPAAQGAAVIGGAALAAWGLARRGVIGALLTATGLGLALRGGLNEPMPRIARRALGREGFEIEKTITVHVPPQEVFGLWSRLDSFPRFMEHVKHVDIDSHDPMRSRWTVDGPARVPITFDAITTQLERPRVIAWTTVPHQPIEHTGVVRFEQVPEGTRVHIHVTYRLPGGLASVLLARLFGSNPKRRMDEDLVRMKSLLEEGRTRAHGGRIEWQDLLQ